MQEETKEIKPAKPFASIAQIKRCDGLIEAGQVTKEVFERDLLATDIQNIPWRKGPAKEEDGSQECQEAYRIELVARKALISAANRSAELS